MEKKLQDGSAYDGNILDEFANIKGQTFRIALKMLRVQDFIGQAAFYAWFDTAPAEDAALEAALDVKLIELTSKKEDSDGR